MAVGKSLWSFLGDGKYLIGIVVGFFACIGLQYLMSFWDEGAADVEVPEVFEHDDMRDF